MQILRNQKPKALQEAIIHLKANKVAQGKIKSRRESPHSAMKTQMLYSHDLGGTHLVLEL